MRLKAGLQIILSIAHVSCAAEVTPLVKYIPETGKKLMDAFCQAR